MDSEKPVMEAPDRQKAEKQEDKPNSPIIARPIILGDLTLANPTTQTTVGAAGGASALPATPTGYLTVNLGNGPVVIAYYAVS